MDKLRIGWGIRARRFEERIKKSEKRIRKSRWRKRRLMNGKTYMGEKEKTSMRGR